MNGLRKKNFVNKNSLNIEPLRINPLQKSVRRTKSSVDKISKKNSLIKFLKEFLKDKISL